MLIDKLEHVLIDVPVGRFDPIFFNSDLNKSQFGEQIKTFGVSSKDITVELVHLKCFEAITCQAFDGHCRIAFSPV
jgi:hypothetical protein